MAPEKHNPTFQFEISLSVLNHLGRNLYRNFITVLGEAISNSWDADAENVWINIDRENACFSIKDDGRGMNSDDFQNKFLKIGYSKRKEGVRVSPKGRPYIGAKGIGKLALLSCAQRVSIFTKTDITSYVGGVIDNSGLDEAIKDDLTADEYPLEGLDFGLITDLTDNHEKGTIIFFEQTRDQLKNLVPHLKKLLAMSFKFSLFDKNFTIYVNGEEVTANDLKDLSNATQLLWLVNQYTDTFVDSFKNLKAPVSTATTSLDIKGFIASVQKPRHLKITGTDERATIDLFVNGRLREKNIIRHIPTQRVVESYLYGQIHFDILDREGTDPFTSSREGIVEDDLQFKSLMEYLKTNLIRRVMNEWDKLRLDLGDTGDDENPRKSKKARKARDLYSAAKEEYQPDEGAAEKDQVENWLKELQPDAEFNISAYVDCFLSENLVRKYIHDQKTPLDKWAQDEIKTWKSREGKRKGEANISFAIRKDNDDLSYLGMDDLAVSAEGSKTTSGKPSLWADAIKYRPVRNAVGHTGLLTKNAKLHLTLTYENIKSRVKTLLATGSK